MYKIKILLFLTLSLYSFTLNAGESIKSGIVAKNSGYKLCNHHKFTYLMLNVYDVYLCTSENQYLFPEEIFKTDFSLVINYNMNFDKENLSKSSIEEINRYYNVSKQDQENYYQQLMKIFPNVKKGDVIEAKYNRKGFIDFYHNKSLTGKIEEGKFSKIFLDIWLYKNNKYQTMIKDLFRK